MTKDDRCYKCGWHLTDGLCACATFRVADSGERVRYCNDDGSLTAIGRKAWALGIEEAKIAHDGADYSGCDCATKDLIAAVRSQTIAECRERLGGCLDVGEVHDELDAMEAK